MLLTVAKIGRTTRCGRNARFSYITRFRIICFISYGIIIVMKHNSKQEVPCFAGVFPGCVIVLVGNNELRPVVIQIIFAIYRSEVETKLHPSCKGSLQ